MLFRSLQELSAQAADGWQLSAKIWLQHSHRQIAPTLLQSSSSDQQTDRSLRLTAHAERQGSHSRSRLQQTYSREYLLFQTPALQALSQTQTLQTSLNHRHIFGNLHLLELTAQYFYAQAQSPSGYAATATQHRSRLSAFYRYRSANERWQISALTRGEYLWGLYPRAALSLQSHYQAARAWRLRLHAAHNYRLPTLNDWYWRVGGNPNLRPESNQIAEIALQYERPQGSSTQQIWRIQAEAQAYYSQTRDYIAWLPDERTAQWSVFNLGSVQAFGVQTQGRVGLHLDSLWRIELSPRYSFTRAYEIGNSEKSQLIYAPQHQAQAQLQAAYGERFGAFYRQEWTGARRVDERTSLPRYSLADAGIWANLRCGKFGANVELQVYNLFNRDVQIIANRPMPRRWWALSIRFDLHSAPQARKREG